MDFLEISILNIEWIWTVCLYWMGALRECGDLDICMIDYFTFINCVNHEEAFNELIFDHIFIMEALFEIENCDILSNVIYRSSAISNSFYLSYSFYEWSVDSLFIFQIFCATLVFDWDILYEIFFNNFEMWDLCWPCVTYFDYFTTTASSNVFYETDWINSSSIAYIDNTDRKSVV